MRLIGIAVLVGAAAGDAGAQMPFPIEEVASGVFVHEGEVALAAPANEGAIANSGFVVGEDAVAVIDPGGSASAGEALLAAVRQQTDLPIRYILYTHVHPDHVLGAQPVQAGSESPEIVAHARLPRALAARAEHYLASVRQSLGEAAAQAAEVVLPDRLVEHTATLDLGGRKLVLRAWPTAHTDNDLTILDEETGTLFTGDLVFVDHLPVIDGSISGWLALHEPLRELEVARIVPGHGPAPLDWPEAAEPQFAYLQSLADAMRQQIDEGATLAEAVEAVPAPEGDWSLVEDFHRRNATAAFTELEWE